MDNDSEENKNRKAERQAYAELGRNKITARTPAKQQKEEEKVVIIINMMKKLTSERNKRLNTETKNRTKNH